MCLDWNDETALCLAGRDEKQWLSELNDEMDCDEAGIMECGSVRWRLD